MCICILWRRRIRRGGIIRRLLRLLRVDRYVWWKMFFFWLKLIWIVIFLCFSFRLFFFPSVSYNSLSLSSFFSPSIPRIQLLIYSPFHSIIVKPLSFTFNPTIPHPPVHPPHHPSKSPIHLLIHFPFLSARPPSSTAPLPPPTSPSTANRQPTPSTTPGHKTAPPPPTWKPLCAEAPTLP